MLLLAVCAMLGAAADIDDFASDSAPSIPVGSMDYAKTEAYSATFCMAAPTRVRSCASVSLKRLRMLMAASLAPPRVQTFRSLVPLAHAGYPTVVARSSPGRSPPPTATV